MLAARSGEGAKAVDQVDIVALAEPVLPDAFRLAVAMLRSESDAEDAVQEALIKAWRHRDRFRADAEMRPWLLTIVANECRSMRRNRWWNVIKWPEIRPHPVNYVPSSTDLRRGIHQLTHEQKLAVVLRYCLDLPFNEIALVLKTTPKAAKSRTYRALERLRLNPEVTRDE